MNMRVLWIAPNGGNYNSRIVKGTGGWIGALQTELLKHGGIELGITFVSTVEDGYVTDCDGVTYIPIKLNTGSNRTKAFFHNWFGDEKKDEKIVVEKIVAAINKFTPDIVHVWGVENIYAAVIPYINCPFVVHIQGLLSPSMYVYVPYGFSLCDLRKANTLTQQITNTGNIKAYRKAEYRANREMRVTKYVKNWIGRTDWDKSMSMMLSPNSTYYHCDELMRKDFDGKKWQYHYDGETIHIQSCINANWYKGMDVILKVADVLKNSQIKIEWNVFGVSRDNPRLMYIIKKLGMIPERLGVRFCGLVDGKTLQTGLLKSDVFVHPSYIENSSNAIAEAMMVGVPTIAQNVGGNSTMLIDGSGILVAPNEPYIMASHIINMCNKEVAEDYSEKARAVASKRQNKDTIINDLVNIYRQIASVKL